jgi:N-succinyldiaminopimelate aminotransferase
MAFPERFSNLPDYAFPRLRKLLDAHAPGGEPIAMTIGEPKHPMPDFVGPILAENLAGFGIYPPNDGTPGLLAAIAGWIGRRYDVALAEDRLMALNGTREGLFNAAVALCPETKGRRPVVLMPNPFYQVYAVAALAVGAEPVYVPATAATGFLPDYAACRATCWTVRPSPISARRRIRRARWPGATILPVCWRWPRARFHRLGRRMLFRDLARGAASRAAGGARDADPERVVVPLAVQAVEPAGPAVGLRRRRARKHDPHPPAARLRWRAAAPAAAEGGRSRLVRRGACRGLRALYQQKFHTAAEGLCRGAGFRNPDGGFFLWLPVESLDDGEAAALKLWRETGVRVSARRLSVA